MKIENFLYMYVIKISCVHFREFFAAVCFNICTKATASKTTLVVVGAPDLVSAISSMQVGSSLFVPEWLLPPSDAEGHAWISQRKNSSKFPFLLWQLMHSREKSWALFLRQASFCFSLLTFITGWALNTLSLFRWIVSLTGLILSTR